MTRGRGLRPLRPRSFAYGEQGLCPCTPPEGACPLWTAPVSPAATRGAAPGPCQRGLRPLWTSLRSVLSWAERRVTDAPHDLTWLKAGGCGLAWALFFFLVGFQQGESPLRKRPKGFAVALWKPSHALLINRLGFFTLKMYRIFTKRIATSNFIDCGATLVA